MTKQTITQLFFIFMGTLQSPIFKNNVSTYESKSQWKLLFARGAKSLFTFTVVSWPLLCSISGKSFYPAADRLSAEHSSPGSRKHPFLIRTKPKLTTLWQQQTSSEEEFKQETLELSCYQLFHYFYGLERSRSWQNITSVLQSPVLSSILQQEDTQIIYNPNYFSLYKSQWVQGVKHTRE